ncbi:hypothetical protein EON81_15470 [bacterium]|nr:MAG: hypothetical protein EON81_15470 [bacterium]
MLLIAYFSLHLLSQETLLVSDVVEEKAQLKVVDFVSRKSRVIDSRTLPFLRTHDLEDRVHNEFVRRSLAFAVDRNRGRIAKIDIGKHHPAPIVDGEPVYLGWTSDIDLLTLDFAGNVVKRERTTIGSEGNLYLGFGDGGFAELVRPGEFKDGVQVYGRFAGGRWVNDLKFEALPSSFKSLRSERVIGKRQRDDASTAKMGSFRPLAPFAASTGWVDANLTSFMDPDYRLYGVVDPVADSTVAWSRYAVAARWKGKRLNRGKMDHLFPLRYPLVVGRISPKRELLPEYATYDLFPDDPYIASDIWTLDLATKQYRKICRGIYAVPL